MDNPQPNKDHIQPTGTPGGHIMNAPTGGENVYPVEQRDNIVNNGQVNNGILDVIYGVLFDPVRTFAGFAQKPPIGTIVTIFVALNLAEALTGIFTTPVYLERINLGGLPGVTGVSQALLSFVAIAGFLFSVIKWFSMAGLLHLLAELYGGSGTARSVWAVYGAAGLPAVFMIPVQIVTSLVNTGGLFDFMAGLLTLGLYAWGIILLIIGLREVHHFSTGRAVLVVMTPGLMLVFLTMVSLMFIGTAASTIMQYNF